MKEFNQFENSPSEPIQLLQLEYLDKLAELEEYFNIGKNGYIKTSNIAKALPNKKSKSSGQACL